MQELILAIIEMTLLAAPWLLLGLVVAGLVRGLVPRARIRQWLSGDGLQPILRGAVLGVPLPMCSCGAIPTALALYRSGAGRGPTTSFLVGTPGAGIDSLSLTFVLMGPFMMVARALGAIVAAVSTGLLTALSHGTGPVASADPVCSAGCSSSGCGSGDAMADADETAPGLRHGLRYAFTEMLDDISIWIAIGLAVAGLLITLTPPQGLAMLGSGIGPMLLMALIGVPLYLCAAATTPIAAALMLEGLSPGTALVLMLAGPVTSLATLSIFQREMGTGALLLYLTGIVLSTVAAGLVTDAVITAFGLDIQGSVQQIQGWVPAWLEWSALALLVILSVPLLRRTLIRETHDD